MLRDIHLHGSLAEFGDHYRLDVRDAGEACRALACQLRGFRETVEAGHWHVFRGPLEAQNDIGPDDVNMGLGQASEIHIVPVAEGAGEVFNIIAGVGLLALTPLIGPGALYAGGALALGGVASLLTSPPTVDSYSSRERPDERPSFLFDGPTNTSTQGLPVPLVYGRMRVGSIVVSADLSADDIGVGDEYMPSDPTATS